MPRYHMHLISALRLLPLVFPAHGIRDSGVLCDGLGCEDVLEVAHVRPDGKRESLAQLAGQQLVHGVPRASGGPSAAGAPADETSSGIANEKLLKFWAVAIGLYAVLAVVSVGIWEVAAPRYLRRESSSCQTLPQSRPMKPWRSPSGAQP